MRTIHRTIVSALIYSHDGKLLMGKKDPQKGGVYSDCWHIPGGGMEEGEDRIDALKRELKEEVGLQVSSSQIEFVHDTETGVSEKTLSSGERVIAEMQFILYKVVLEKNSSEIPVYPGDDLIVLRWFSLSELATVNLTPPSKKYFHAIGYI